MNRKNILNVIASVMTQATVLVFGLIIPRLILVNYGSDTNGLTSTIAQVFTYLILLEAGIGQATKNALYKPISTDSKAEISKILSISRRYYRKVSIFYFASVCLLAAVLPILLKTTVDYWTVFFLIFLEGLSNVVLFYFINSWNCFLMANGKGYVVNFFLFITKLVFYLIKILLVINRVNIALIQLSFFFVTLVELALYMFYMKKKYNWIDYSQKGEAKALSDKNAYIVTEIAWTVFSSTDLIVLSIFISTQFSSVYSVYNMVFVALSGLLSAIYNSVNFNLGKAYNEDIEQYKKVHDIFNSVFVGSITALMCVTYLLIIPFVQLYTKGVTDINYINKQLPFLFCAIQLLSWSRYVSGNLTGIGGYAKQTSYISVIEAFINLSLSIVLVFYLGIVGVLLATLIALPLKVIYCNYLSDRVIMKRKPWNTILVLMSNYAIFAMTLLINHLVAIDIQSYAFFTLYGLLLTILYFVITIFVNAFVNRSFRLFITERLFGKKKIYE